MLSLTRVRVHSTDVAAIDAQLHELARQMPQAVVGMPVILEADAPLDLGVILASLKNVGMQPLACVEGPLTESARNWGLAVLPPDSGSSRTLRQPSPPAPASAETPSAPAVAARKPARIVTEPVRSGQQIYAQDSDLILTNTISAGAEVAADGCVHVYAALRGRAIAGAQGDITARVFCRRLESELIAIAGVYAVAEQMHGDLHGKPVQAFLQNGKLKIERLEW